MRAAHVESTHADAGRLAQHRPDVGGGGDLLQFSHAEVVHQRRRLCVHQRCIAPHRDRFGNLDQFQRRVDPDHAVPFDGHAFTHHGSKSRQLEHEAVRTPSQRPEPIGTVSQRDSDLRGDQRFIRDGDCHSRHRKPLAIYHRAFNLSGNLGARGGRKPRHQQERARPSEPPLCRPEHHSHPYWYVRRGRCQCSARRWSVALSRALAKALGSIRSRKGARESAASDRSLAVVA